MIFFYYLPTLLTYLPTYLLTYLPTYLLQVLTSSPRSSHSCAPRCSEPARRGEAASRRHPHNATATRATPHTQMRPFRTVDSSQVLLALPVPTSPHTSKPLSLKTPYFSLHSRSGF